LACNEKIIADASVSSKTKNGRRLNWEKNPVWEGKGRDDSFLINSFFQPPEGLIVLVGLNTEFRTLAIPAIAGRVVQENK